MELKGVSFVNVFSGKPSLKMESFDRAFVFKNSIVLNDYFFDFKVGNYYKKIKL